MTEPAVRPQGRARRLIDLRRWDPHTVVGWLEDDFHHFGVTVVHREGHVVDVSMSAPRYPYTTCIGAAQPLRALIGAPLVARCSDIGKWIDMRLQCTHVFDLAGLVLAHAAAGRVRRRYEATVEDRQVVQSDQGQRRTFGPGSAVLYRDGELVLEWQIDGHRITAPADWAGRSLQDGLRAHTETLDVEAAEQATILRRTIFIAAGRSANSATRPLPGERQLPAVCHTFQPGERERARRMSDNTRDYAASSEGMLLHADTKP